MGYYESASKPSGSGSVEVFNKFEQSIDLSGVGKDAVNALGMEGGEGNFPKFFEFDGTISGNVSLEQFEKANLVGVERGILLNKALEVLIHLGSVHSDNAANGKSKAPGSVRIMI